MGKRRLERAINLWSTDQIPTKKPSARTFKQGDRCVRCHKGKYIVKRNSWFMTLFLGCSEFPACYSRQPYK